MLWIVCFIISLLLTAAGVNELFAKRHGKLRYALVCISLAAASIAIYWPYYFLQHNVYNTTLSSVFNTMQMIALNSDFYGIFEVAREQIGSSLLGDLYICLLAVIHILLPLATIFTAYNIIAYCLAHAKLTLKHLSSDDIFVFSACSAKTEFLARDINEKHGKKAAFIFVRKKDDDAIDTDTADLLNHILYDDDIAKIKIKLKKSRLLYYFNLSEDEDENMNNTLSLIDKYAGSPFQSNIHIITFLKNDESDLLIDASSKGKINIHIVDEDQASVYRLLYQKPLYTALKENLISLLIAGFGNDGAELLKAAVWCGQLEGMRLKIRILTNDIEQKKAKLIHRLPDLLCDDYDIEFLEANTDDTTLGHMLRQHCMDTTYAVVTGDNDEENINTAVYLRRFFLRNSPDFNNMPFIAVKVRSHEKYDSIRNIATPEANQERKTEYNIYPYGNEREVYSYGELVDSTIEKLARNVHLTYEEIFSDGSAPDVPAALDRYNVFEVKKRSNRANAMHIKYKLWLLGLEYTDDEEAEEADFNEYLDEELLDRLAVVEHDRWMAFLRSEGWAGASVDESKCFRALSKGRHECSIIKLHPYICPFEDLEERSEALQLPDATVYDIELIRRIPDILHDKWGAAGKSYRIVKSGSGEEN